MLYGIGSAVTLDEFALWLNLEDDYWNREGRKSIEAVVLFAALLSLGIWGGPLFRKARSSVKKLTEGRGGYVWGGAKNSS